MTITAPFRLLILGGTQEAANIARMVTHKYGQTIEVISSLAGRTEPHGPLPGKVRIGGFGGVEGLVDYLQRQQIHALLDATHPFASRISWHAAEAAALTGIPRLRYERPSWTRQRVDRWIEVADERAAATALIGIAQRIWLTLGSRDLDCFVSLDPAWFLVRMIELPKTPLPLVRHEITLGRGPFTVEEERELIETYEIDALVTKASGGAATEAKLIAAREAGIPVIMIRRPVVPPGDTISGPSEAIPWIEARLREYRNQPRFNP